MVKLTQEVIDRFMQVAPAQIGHLISSGFMHPRIKPVSPSFKIIGNAYTVRMTDRDSTALYYALMKAEPGQIIVVDRGSDDIFACVGDQLALMAKHRGIGGIVIDGPATDRVGLEILGFPVFCSGFSPVTCLLKGTSGEVQVPIECGGAVVHPGDLIFGDADGVIVVPDDYEHLLVAAEKMTANERRRAERVEKEGYKFLRRDDVDVEKLFEFDMEGAIAEIKKKCGY